MIKLKLVARSKIKRFIPTKSDISLSYMADQSLYYGGGSNYFISIGIRPISKRFHSLKRECYDDYYDYMVLSEYRYNNAENSTLKKAITV